MFDWSFIKLSINKSQWLISNFETGVLSVHNSLFITPVFQIWICNTVQTLDTYIA